MRNGQIQQLFIILSALLIVGATIFLGSKLIGGLMETNCKVGDASFMEQLEKQIDSVSNFGSRRVVEVIPSCNALALCFVDADSLGDATFQGNDSTINTSVHNDVKTNIFVQGRKTTSWVGYDSRIILVREPETTPVPKKDLCIEGKSGKFRFLVEGYGRFVRISPAE